MAHSMWIGAGGSVAVMKNSEFFPPVGEEENEGFVPTVEDELYDAVMPIIYPLLSVTAAENVYDEGGMNPYTAGAVALALNSLTVPLPKSALDIIEEFIPKLDGFNRDSFGVFLALGRCKERVGIDKDA